MGDVQTTPSGSQTGDHRAVGASNAPFDHTLLLTLMHEMPESIYLKDRSGRFLQANRALAQYFGVGDPAELIGRTDFDFYPEADAHAFQVDEERVMATGQPLVGKIERCAAGGTERWYSTTKVPVRDDSGTIVGVAGISRDISALKQTRDDLRAERHRVEQRILDRTAELESANARLRESETRFRELAENIHEVFWLTNVVDQKVEYVSPAYETIFGSSREKLYANALDWTRVIHDEDRERVVAEFEAHAIAGTYDLEYRIVRPDGTERLIRDRGFPIRDEDGSVSRLAGIAEDVTQQRRAEQKLHETTAELSHLARVSTMGELTAALAHELNQPLSAISNYANGCVRRLESGTIEHDDLLEIVRRIAAQSEHAGGVVQRVRQLVQKRPPRPRPVDLNELLHDTRPLLETEVRRHETTLRFELDASSPVVRADAVELRQVILNLVRNACEAMVADGTPEPSVTVRTIDADLGVAIEIVDHGPGLAKEEIEPAFEPFHSTKLSGTGLGLTISRTIITAHGGRLEFRSVDDDHGACFRFILPRDDEGDRSDA